MPFADAASPGLPLSRLLRLALFQVSVGLATALLVGTLNRVMIVELGVHAWIVSMMVALPMLAAPFRAFVGFRSDIHASVIGWRRVPYIWLGTLMQFGGLAIMPFALLVLTGQGHLGMGWVGQIFAAVAFLLVGAGLQTTQTTGLALATDLASEESRPRVVALMYVMLLVGLVGGGMTCSALLSDFSEQRLVEVVQGAAVLTVALNLIAVWKQEARDPNRRRSKDQPAPEFRTMWRGFIEQPQARRFLWMVGLGTAAFNMQDIVLEPYGGEILKLSVAATSTLTALLAGGALVAFALAARMLARGWDPLRVAALGAVCGLPAFALVVFAAPMDSPAMFRIGTVMIGFGGGLFSVGTLTAAMGMERKEHVGLALGAWGAVQATAAGGAVAAGGAMRDLVSSMATQGLLGQVLVSPVTGYSFVYHLEMILLFAALVAIGPLVRRSGRRQQPDQNQFGLADFPG
ncbi:BCD family MFS transporter [Rubrivivax benzoatilyticus]|uniref:BCD family MFS transporter n=2 Tax=Sphaerotilaceae TaxID=2975441 RepID=A0ABX0I0H4_9BURK|nr:BCD family MFS transporter [Rubrivivax benzoatilyticus]MCC9598116.1 BCD family MFS transporter [Rubrivivax sp. JA1055]MCC9645627.1 BCD family MFS transporter [Rubrivivax sp. JA1029]NHK99075.1 BCD family MFS transporter [Rubrivivax benzoatilyticus]NHL25062.1 BCD family MFS transporter [Rubrivivax benzoatilyticus]